MWISVASTRGRLPEGFEIEETHGFGLRAVRSMLGAMNGTIAARNHPGGGTVFSVEIPRAALNKP